MNSSNSLGCSACDCNPIGSTSKFCDPISGQCVCKTNVADRKCDQCEDGYFDFESGCLPCTCNPLGTEADTYCDKKSGQCVCQLNTQGVNCDECKDGAYSFGSDVTFGCQLCNCNPIGALNGSLFCNKTMGECGCKSNVIGLSCNQCRASTWRLSKGDPDGCLPCKCDPSGTNLGGQIAPEELTCDQNSGSCACLTNRLHQKCDDCIPGRL